MNMYDKSISVENGFFFVPITILADNFTITLSGYLEDKLGTRILSLIGIVFGLFCNLIIKFVHNFWILLFSFLLYGIGIGLCYYPILKTCWKYFPNKKGIITGIILCVYGIGNFGFTSLADFIINPDKISPDDNGIYKPEIAIKIKDYSFIMSIIIGSLGIIALILMFPIDNIIGDNNIDEIKENQKENDEEQNENKKEELIENENDKPIKQAILSLRFLLFNLMCVGTLCKFYLNYFD